MKTATDPIYKAIIGAKVSLLVTNTSLGSWLSDLQPIDRSDSCKDIELAGRNLWYNREFIKSLTSVQLREKLIRFAIQRRALQYAPGGPPDAASD
ncbi:hypothetical protein GGD46_005260 [Rhizobium lusitanum]|uniref:Uncharacterized protein n=1 Tax=Rhizobium lusitanum TaxID=293958 RepID=A0A7X0IVF7_9HYPH|nr:hypothetical protein [Rhizobium lusitanum]